MEFFMKVFFWVSLFGVVIRLFIMCISEFPRQRTEKLGEMVAKTIESALWMGWTAILLWMK